MHFQGAVDQIFVTALFHYYILGIFTSTTESYDNQPTIRFWGKLKKRINIVSNNYLKYEHNSYPRYFFPN